MASAPTVSDIRMQRVDDALARKAVILEAAGLLTRWADMQVRSAAKGNCWDLEDEYKAAAACIKAFGVENLESVMDQCRDELLLEHHHDLKENCSVNDAGFPVEYYLGRGM